MQINPPFVDLTSAQSISGAKTFLNTLNVTGTLQQGAGSGEFFVPVTHAATASISVSAVKHCDATAGAIVLTLPTASQDARVMLVKIDASANTVTILPPGAGTIGGAASYVLATQFSAATLLYVGSNNWVVVGKS